MNTQHIAVTAQIKNVLGALMINSAPNGDRLTVIVRPGDGRRARRVLAASSWALAIDVVESPA